MTARALACAGLSLFLAAAAAGVPVSRAEEGIQDNSFLIEEAYNQGRGVVQHIGTYVRSGHAGNWASSFTQEWPDFRWRDASLRLSEPGRRPVGFPSFGACGRTPRSPRRHRR